MGDNLPPLTGSIESPTDPRRLAQAQQNRESLKHPAQIGPYRILSVLGEGGMGVVYLAEQEKPIHRRVALKNIKLGMDTQQVLARFDTEREALALMNHPNVAKVLDAGVAESGRPYFVMEHVPGLSITEYADRHRLNTHERLRLFLDVCHAVHHAHQKGIIHRDIKPSNVLVSVDPGASAPAAADQVSESASKGIEGVHVKVIDFGVAKAVQHRLTERTFFTEQGQLIGTPGYMSPEQAEMSGLDIDTRTDIYSLGVLLYELLVGTRPFDDEMLRRAAYGEIQRIIREVDPPKPSTRLSALSGEEQNIAPVASPGSPLVAAQWSPTPQGSHTGSSLAKIAAHRRTQPRTLIRQIRGDLDWVIMKCLEKDRTRRYESAAALAADVERYLGKMPVLAGPPGSIYKLRKFVSRRRVPVTAGILVVALLAVASALFVQSRLAARDALRERTTALYYEAMLDAYSRPESALKKFQQVVTLQPDFVNARVQRAYLLKRENRFDECLKEATAIVADHPDCGPGHLLLSLLYADRDAAMAAQHRKVGQDLVPNDHYFAALALGPEQNQRAIELLTSVLSHDGSHFDARWSRAWRYHGLKKFESMLADAQVLTELRPRAGTAWNIKGIALERLHKPDEAMAAFNRSIELSPDYAPTYVNRADLYLRTRRLDEALADCNKTLEIDSQYGLGLAHRAWVHFQRGDVKKAELDCRKALNLDKKNPFAWHRLGNVFSAKGDLMAALDAFNKAIEFRSDLSGAWSDRCVSQYKLEQFDQALESITQAIRLDPRDDIALSRRALVLHRLDRPDDALADLNESIRLNPENADALHNRARLRRFMGDLPGAMADHNRAIEIFPSRNTYAGRGITRRYMGDDSGAIADFKLAIGQDPAKAVDVRLWIWEILMLRGGEQDQNEARQYLSDAAGAADDPWDKELVTAITEGTEAGVLLSLTNGPARRCQALYVLGMRALVNGEHAQASDFFAQCLDTQAMDMPDYDLARLHVGKFTSRKPI